MGYSGAEGKMIHEKSRDTVPLMYAVRLILNRTSAVMLLNRTGGVVWALKPRGLLYIKPPMHLMYTALCVML